MCLTVQFDEEHKVLVDHMRLMLSAGDVRWLREKIEQHLSHSTSELEAIGRKTVEEHHPHMVDQFNYDYFKD